MHRDQRSGLSILFITLLTITWVSAGQAQYFECKTVVTAPDSLFAKNLAPPYSDENLVAEVRCVVHVLRENNGSGGLSASDVDSMLGIARQDMLSLGVTLVITDQTDISNSSYYADPDSFVADIFTEDYHEDAIDIYLGPAVGDAFGLAQGIPSSALLLTGTLDSYSALSHVLGHCFGLYDTSETEFGVEAPGGSDGDTTGDLVADTPADPGLAGWVLADCNLAAAFADSFTGYSPDATNLMSISRMSCWSGFTKAQSARVITTIQSAAVLAGATELTAALYVDKTDDTTIARQTHLPKIPSNAAACDVNGDGKKDLLVSGYAPIGGFDNRGYLGSCSTYSDTGVPQFTDATASAFTAGRPKDGTTGLIIADYDNDNDLDFFAPNPHNVGTSGTPYRHSLFQNSGAGAFVDVAGVVGLSGSNAALTRTLAGAWGDFNGDGYLDLLTVIGPPNTSFDAGANGIRLFENYSEPEDGGVRKFRDVTLSSGLSAADLDVRSVLWIDLDLDHDMDLVTIQHVQRAAAQSKYYLNAGGHFTDVTSTRFGNCPDTLNVNHVYAAHGDIDNDGDVDIAYHGSLDRGWLRNDLDASTGISTLTLAWSQHKPVNTQDWPDPMDIEMFDFDLDGCLDLMTPTKDNQHSNHKLLLNNPSTHAFAVVTSGLGVAETFGSCAADFHLDGHTDIFLATELDLSNPDNTRFFMRSDAAINGSETNHWIGIRLTDTDGSCNFRGIGATVIVTAGGHRQAQVVDGGSGQAGQHDLDLSFGLGAHSDSVDVEVIWPCGQTQYARVTADSYHTISMTRPVVDDSSVMMYMNLVLGEDTLDWVFEWTTAMPSTNGLDWVEFPGGLTLYPEIDHIDGSMSDVELAVTNEFVAATNAYIYHHRVTWLGRQCDDEMNVRYKVHSKALTFDDPSAVKSLRLYGCPQS